MTKTNFSRHMVEDRVDRYVTIATKVGFGQVMYTSTYSDRKGAWINRTIELTSTGVCIVKGQDGAIVTMYCATIANIKSYFKIERLPKELFTAVKRNEKNGYCNL